MIFQGAVGQAAAVIVAAQYLDDDSQPVTPTSPQVKIVGGATPAVLATLTPAESLGLTGFMVALLDVSNVLTWPAGQYVVRWTGVTSGKVTSTVDTLQLVPSAAFATSGMVGGSYTTEERIRSVDKALRDERLESPAVALAAANGADYLNGRLGVIFSVPFASPVDPFIVLLNDWKAAAILLDEYYGENGNRGLHAVDLHKWVDDCIEWLLEGEATLNVDPLTEPVGGIAASTDSKHLSYIMPGAVRSLSYRRRD